jgi:hypothetical protein
LKHFEIIQTQMAARGFVLKQTSMASSIRCLHAAPAHKNHCARKAGLSYLLPCPKRSVGSGHKMIKKVGK